jgi:glycine/D-amino acid oxidase-like deaminating enzyme
LHPGKLARSMIKTLPINVELFENTQLLNWVEQDGKIICNFGNYKIESKKIIFCTNGFLSSLGIKQRYNFPISLSASTTRILNKNELDIMGNPSEWGVLSVKPMGATVRLTKDKRITIRNTAEINNSFSMNADELEKRKQFHLKGLKKRFPFLPNDIIEHTWSGIACRSANGAQIFDQLSNNVYVAGCFNGAGIGLGTLFGEQIALKASNFNSSEMELIESQLKPSWLPPQPFLNLGIKAKLIFERYKAKSEI